MRPTELYSTAEAAIYLGTSVSTVRYHIGQGNLNPVKVGNSRVFSKQQLDFFLVNRRKPGRPRKTNEAIS